MKVLNQFLSSLSGIIILTVFTFGVASADNRYSMTAEEMAKDKAAKEQAYAEAYASWAKKRAESEAARSKLVYKAELSIGSTQVAKSEEFKAKKEAVAEEKAVGTQAKNKLELEK